MITRMLAGHFRQPELRAYLAIVTGVFWALIGLCWLSYPTEHHYNIASHTFSFFGSFSEDRNPQWWWIFSIAMMFWAVSMVPLTFYGYHRFKHIAPIGAIIGAGFFLLGSVGIAGVALFPDVSTPVFGATRWTDIHEKAAVMVFIGFLFGITWHALLLAYSRLRRHGETAFRHRHFVPPYFIWTLMLLMAGYFQVTGELHYRELKAAAEARGEHIGSSWSVLMNTRWSFPLWENLTIYTLFLFIIWFMLVIPHEPRKPQG